MYSVRALEKFDDGHPRCTFGEFRRSWLASQEIQTPYRSTYSTLTSKATGDAWVEHCAGAAQSLRRAPATAARATHDHIKGDPRHATYHLVLIHNDHTSSRNYLTRPALWLICLYTRGGRPAPTPLPIIVTRTICVRETIIGSGVGWGEACRAGRPLVCTDRSITANYRMIVRRSAALLNWLRREVEEQSDESGDEKCWTRSTSVYDVWSGVSVSWRSDLRLNYTSSIRLLLVL